MEAVVHEHAKTHTVLSGIAVITAHEERGNSQPLNTSSISIFRTCQKHTEY